MPFSFRSLGYSARPDEVSKPLLNKLLQRARFIHPEDAEFANRLWPQAADFLSGYTLRALIRDDTSGEEIAWEIEENKKLLNKLSSLLPALSDLFSPDNPDNLEGFCSCIDDCCGDYRTSKNRLRKDRQLREALDAIESASEHIVATLQALDRVARYVEFDYRDLHNAHFSSKQEALLPYAGRIEEKHNPFSAIEVLSEQMKICLASLKIAQIRTKETPQTSFMISERGKAVIVDYAHTMSLMWNGPPLTTTPGSDFALLCSLLFECATGEADEGLAGAINRYARSPGRQKKEDEEAEYRKDELSEDNFRAIRSQMQEKTKEIEECRKLIESPLLDDYAKLLLLQRAERNLRIIGAASQLYGPLQVSMSELNDDQLAELKPIDLRAIARVDMEIGNRRRSGKASNSPD